MKIHALLIIGLFLSISGCAEKKQAAPASSDDMATTMKPAPPAAATEAVATSDAVLRHMHMHARQLGLLNLALARGDLEAAHTPAYWLSRHEGMSVFPADWQPHLQQMRVAALEVEAAPDINTASAAAARIGEACQACHASAGFEVDITRMEFD